MSRPKSALDRALSVFSDVRGGEAATVLLMLANIFVVLTGYYVIKTVREPLILASGGAELKSYAAAGQAVVLMGFVPLYAYFVRRVSRAKLIVGVNLFFIGCIELFYGAAYAGVPNLGIVFYIWVGIFSLAIIAQFWSYANDIYTRDVGERLFPVIAIGATLGSPLGSALAAKLFDWGISPYEMLQVPAFLLLVSLGLYRIVDRRMAARTQAPPPEPIDGPGGFALVFASPYLRLIALLLIVLNVVNTTGEYILSASVTDAAKAAADAAIAVDPTVVRGPFIGQYIGSFYGKFFSVVNVVAVVLQALIVSRLVKYLGMRGVLFALPIVAFGAYGLVVAGVGISVFRWAKTAENATDYSVMNTARNLLWLPTSRAEKYKAKQAIDTFFTRLGDVLSAGLVYAGLNWLDFGLQDFAVFSLVLIVVWMALAVALVKRNAALVAARAAAEGDR